MLRIRTPFMARCVPDTILCENNCHWLPTGRWSSPGAPVSSTNKTDRHDVESGVQHFNPNDVFLRFTVVSLCRLPPVAKFIRYTFM
jgi:hypothetical protein